MYDGDDSVINPSYSHGNSKNREKLEKPYIRTVPSVLATAKERKNDPPLQAHEDIIDAAPTEMKRQAVEASRDTDQECPEVGLSDRKDISRFPV